MIYRLYCLQYDEWMDEEERTIGTGSNRSQMDTLFDLWVDDFASPKMIRVVLETDKGDVLREQDLEHSGGFDDD